MQKNCNMGLSVIAVNQREKEEEKLRSFLTYSLLGSVAFHAIVLFFGTMLWGKQVALAEDPIEVIMVDPPAEETPIEPIVSPSPPAPSPSPVETPIPQPPPTVPPKLAESLPQPKPIETPIPQPPPTVPPKLAESLPQPKPIETPIPPPPPTVPPKLAQPLAQTPPPEAPKPVVTPTTPVEPERELTQLRRDVVQNQPLRPQRQEQRQPLLTPKENSRPSEEPLRQSAPDEPVSSDTPLTSPPVNPVAPRQQPVAGSTALPGGVGGGGSGGFGQGRPSFDNPSNSPSGSPGSSIAGEDTGIPSSGLPGRVAVNRGEPPRRPIAGSTALPTGLEGGGSGSFGQGRPSFDNPSNSPSGSPGSSIAGEDTGIPSSGLPGRVAVSRGEPPRRPVAGSTALPAGLEGGGSGGFGQGRPSFDNPGGSGSGPGTGSGGSEDTGIPSSGVGPGRVAVNRGVPPRPPSNAGQGTDDGPDAIEVDGEGLNCLSSCEPEYPRRLQARGVEGRPVIRFVLDPSGRPMNMQLAESSGDRDLDGAAIEAVRKMRFAPPGSRPLRVRMGINFTLRG